MRTRGDGRATRGGSTDARVERERRRGGDVDILGIDANEENEHDDGDDDADGGEVRGQDARCGTRKARARAVTRASAEGCDRADAGGGDANGR